MSCVIPGCHTTKAEKISLHLFPDPTREPERHLKWVKIVNADRIYQKDPLTIFKQLRVCRKHFGPDSFNGQCKKLLNTAIPSLYINASTATRSKTKLLCYEEKIKKLLKTNTSIEQTLDLLQEEDSSDDLMNLKETLEADDEKYELVEVIDNDEKASSFTILMDDLPASPAPPPPVKILNYKPPASQPKQLQQKQQQVFKPAIKAKASKLEI